MEYLKHLNTLYLYLLAFNVLDFVSGFINALVHKQIKSSAMRQGILTKLLIWIVIAVSFILQESFKIPLIQYTCYYYYIMECISIFENISDYLPVPEKLKLLLEKNKET